MLIPPQSITSSTASHQGPAAPEARPTQAVDNASELLSQRAGSRAAAAGAEFEAVFLRQFIEIMMPEKSAQVFGGGTAGGMWRSLLADGIAKLVAEHGLLGIAKYVSSTDLTSLEQKET